MARINDRFATIAQTGWAQGARAANDICKNLDATSVGGMFTGFEVKTSAGWRLRRPARWRVLLQQHQRRWFDSTLGELRRKALRSAISTPRLGGRRVARPPNTAARSSMRWRLLQRPPAGRQARRHLPPAANSLVSDRIKAGRVVWCRSCRRRHRREERLEPPARLSRDALVTESAAARATTGVSTVPLPVPVPSAPAGRHDVLCHRAGRGAFTNTATINPETGTAPNRSRADRALRGTPTPRPFRPAATTSTRARGTATSCGTSTMA